MDSSLVTCCSRNSQISFLLRYFPEIKYCDVRQTMPLDTDFPNGVFFSAPDRFVPCTYCDFKSKNKYNVTRHIKIKHLKARDFKCSLCDFASGTQQNLSKHTNEVHEKIRDHMCDLCGCKFSRIGNLRDHVKTVHNKIKNYECTICGRKFARNKHLKCRIKNNHERDIVVPESTQDPAEQQRTPKNMCEPDVEIICQKCGFKSAKVSNWDRHVKEPCGRDK